MKVDFPWDIGDRVIIGLLDVEGEVWGLYVEESGALKAEVRYANDGVLCSLFCLPRQLSSPTETPIGLNVKDENGPADQQ